MLVVVNGWILRNNDSVRNEKLVRIILHLAVFLLSSFVVSLTCTFSTLLCIVQASLFNSKVLIRKLLIPENRKEAQRTQRKSPWYSVPPLFFSVAKNFY